MSFYTKKHSKAILEGISTEDIDDEYNKRKARQNRFPLEVFHDKLQPYISWMISPQGFDCPPSFVGLSLLSAYSAAIGTGYVVSTNGRNGIFLPVWACLLGISSSGKSLAISKILEPLINIQKKFDSDWLYETKGLPDSAIAQKRIPTIIYRDVHVATLTRSILPDNPKGLLKMADELLEWINGMNALSKGKDGIDEQFWLSTFNCAPYTGIRSGKQKFICQRPFVGIIGGTQPKVVHRFFDKDRDTSGFIFRLLFARPEIDKIAEPNPEFQMTDEVEFYHTQSIQALYNRIEVENDEDEPRFAMVTREASKLYNIWVKERITVINALDDIDEKDTQSSILGKIKEYVLRFAGILAISDKAIDAEIKDGKLYPYFSSEETITSEHMKRAIALGTYFFIEAIEIYAKVRKEVNAPKEHIFVQRYATMVLSNGKTKTYQEICEQVFPEYFKKYKHNPGTIKQFMAKFIKNSIKNYPRVWGSYAK
jgi:hypothetical protein